MSMELDIRNREDRQAFVRLAIASLMIGTLMAVQVIVIVENSRDKYWCSGLIAGMCAEVVIAVKWVFPSSSSSYQALTIPDGDLEEPLT